MSAVPPPPGVVGGAIRVRAGRDAYLAENGFTVEAYDAKWTPGSLFGFTFKVPNTPTHRRAIMWHDLHHVATGFGTDLRGEGEISAWELRRGLAGLDLYVSAIVVTLALTGFVIAPVRTWRAWQAGTGTAGNLFARPLSDYDATLAIDVAELRRNLDLPAHGLSGERGLHSTAPSVVPP